MDLPSVQSRIELIDDWEEATADANKAARRDRDYYDGHQWTKDEIEKLKRRHQPALVKNRIARKINFILGEEDRKRINPVAMARNPQDIDAARAATDALRYVADEQKFDEVRAAMFRSMLIEGVGGALKEVEQLADGTYAHRLRHVEFDRLAYDQHSRAVDFSDAGWLALLLWMDIDDAIARWPDAEDALREAVNKASMSSQTDDAPRQWVSGKRERVKVCELYQRIGETWYRFVFTDSADIEEPAESWLRDEHGATLCPLVLMSCYVDAENRRYGIVRSLISPQDEVNKRSSKALHQLSVYGAVAERDAIRDPDKFMTELAKPDGFAEVEPGAMVEGRFQVRESGAIAQGQMQLLQEAKADIDSIGPSAATMPELPNTASGVAFAQRRSAAAQELGAVFRQLHNWSMRIFELDWHCIRAYWTDEKWMRVTDDAELTGYRFTALNRTMTRAERMREILDASQGADPHKALAAAAGTAARTILADVERQHAMMAQQVQMAMQQAQASGMPPPPQLAQAASDLDSPDHVIKMLLAHPAMAETITVNQVEQMTVDIVLDEAPDTAIMAQEEFATLAELLPTVAQARPDVAPKLVAMMLRASSLPDKRELMKLIDAPPDPQAAQAQAQAQQMAQAQAQAGMQVAQSQAALNQARAQAEQAKVQIDGAKVQQSGAKVPSEIKRNEAAAVRDVSNSMPRQLPMPMGVM